MAYDQMLLADPGTERTVVLQVLGELPGVRPDPELDNRFWLHLDAGEAQINIGTKDPVESVHVEFEIGKPDLAEAVTHFSLELAARLDMRVEDMQYLHEIDETSLPQLRRFWAEQAGRRPGAPPPVKKPWWKPW